MRFFLTLLLCLPALADDPAANCPPCPPLVIDGPPAPAATRIVLETQGLFVEQGTVRYGPFPVQPSEVATSPDGTHFALAYEERPSHWTLVVDSIAHHYMGVTKVHALSFESDRLLVAHVHRGSSSEYSYLWLSSPPP